MALRQQLPAAILQDYSDRRGINLEVSLAIINLVAEEIIDVLSMPQDDAAPAGFTRLDQRKIVAGIDRQNLGDRIHLYPGADELWFHQANLAKGLGQIQSHGLLFVSYFLKFRSRIPYLVKYVYFLILLAGLCLMLFSVNELILANQLTGIVIMLSGTLALYAGLCAHKKNFPLS